MSNLKQPQHPLRKDQVLPILFLADRMAKVDGSVVQEEESVIDTLADAAEMTDFREERGYRLFGEDEACNALKAELARTGAMVLMSLVLKGDCERAQPEHEFFTRIRAKLNAEPVTVPIDIEAHKELAFRYIQ